VEVIARELGRDEPKEPKEQKEQKAPIEPVPGWSAWREPARPLPMQGSPLRAAPSSPSAPLPFAPAEARVLEGPTVPPPPPAQHKGRWAAMIGLGAAAIAVVGWFAMRGLREGSLESATTTTEAVPMAAAPTPPPPDTAVPDSAAVPAVATPPTDPAARQVYYDSLFAARSSLFDVLIAAVEPETKDRPVKRAIAAWRAGPVDAQDADLIHSALLQHELKSVDPRIEIDGQVLRNPCRGRSCTALLTVWKTQRERYGLPPVPADATTNAKVLRQAEAAVVLAAMREVPATGPGTP
jgi:hypothetical protein